MSQKHGPWIIHDSAERYKGEMVTVVEDKVTKPDGSQGEYATVRLPAGVAVLAIDERGRALLVRQFRYALGDATLEVVSGARDEGESEEAAARRELREELGIEAEELTSLARMDMDTSIVRAPVDLFLARGLRRTEKDEDATEETEEVAVEFDDAVGRVMRGEITHSPSCVVILKAREHLRRS